MNIDIERQVL